MSKMLVVYSLMQHPLRLSVRDHLYAFRRYSDRECVYLNTAVREVPDWICRTDFDAIIFHTSFCSTRWDPSLFEQNLERALPLLELDARRVALPQDEFLRTDQLSDFINQFEIHDLFSVAPPSEWPKIYARVDRERVRFSQVLTGYLSEDAVRQVSSQEHPRPIDVGYRAWEGAMWLGRHGRLKAELAEIFRTAADEAGLRADISTRDADTLLGKEWFKFLLRCRFTIGVEGGASILDRDGTLKGQVESYLDDNPSASFAEVEAACFPGRDGELALFAISPRHLEACLTRTCQVLVEGKYNEILRPGEHYVELRRDLSNLGEVVELIQREDVRRELAEAAYREVVTSGHYTYRGFVECVERQALGDERVLRSRAPSVLRMKAAAADGASWLTVRRQLGNLGPSVRVREAAKTVLPDGAVSVVRRVKRRLGRPKAMR